MNGREALSDMEERAPYLTDTLNPDKNHATLRQDGKGTLSWATIEDIEAQIDQIERHLIPFLNSLRAARGKKPVIVPKG